jgi:hypothetical protein
VIIGLPWYGYDWLGKSAKSLVYSDAMELAQRVGARIDRDANGEATFSYEGRTVYFQDASSYARKIDTIVKRHANIGGFAHWRAGGEDPAIWTDVARLRGSSSVPAQPAPGNFVINGPVSLVARAGQQAQALYDIVPVDGFDGTASVSVQQVEVFPGLVSVTSSARVGSPAVLTLTPNAGAQAGVYRLRIRMTSGDLVNETIVNVQVEGSGKRRSVRR